MSRKAVLNTLVTIGSCQEFIDQVFFLVERKLASYVCFANVHMVMEGYNNPAFQKVVNDANLVAPDGKPISLFLTLLENTKQERICGMDLLPTLLQEAEARGKAVYFFGGSNELLAMITSKATKEFPRLRISGCYSPPFRSLSANENETIIDAIKAASPDLVFVSLGCPKQEIWMAENRFKLGACLLGVGQAFSTYAGKEKRLPKWMRNLSLEWVYRLFHEPGRLWKRYLFTNSHFLLLTFRHAILRLIASGSTAVSTKSYRETPLQESDE